jgi:endonuclease/exonuclease/phosphatase family metal-dependent hydrolase
MFSALTFNMQNGQPWDEEDPGETDVNLEATWEFLREQDADVIFLQEVERRHEGGRQVEPPPHYAWLKERLSDYDSVFAYPHPNPDEIPFGLGLAIFSRTPLRAFRRVDLAPAELSFDFQGVTRKPSHRLLIGAETVIAEHALTLFNTHLQAYFMLAAASSDAHRGQRDRVEQVLRETSGPLLMGGDFNSAPGESLVAQFGDAGFSTCQNSEVTWRREPFVLDHLFHNPAFRSAGCRVIPTLASDHHAVRADFEFVQ